MRHAALTCASSRLVESQTQRIGRPRLRAAWTTGGTGLARDVGIVENDSRPAGCKEAIDRREELAQRNRPIRRGSTARIPRATNVRASVLLPAPGRPMISASSPSIRLRDLGARRTSQDLPRGEALVQDRAVLVREGDDRIRASDRRGLDPSRARNRQDPARRGRSSQASAISKAVASWRFARSASVASESVRRRRRAPPSGRCAITWMPFARQYWTTPLRRPPSCQTLSSICTEAISVICRASSICADVDVAQTDLLDQAVASEGGQRADARGQRRSRIGRMELIQLDALDAERPAARFAGGTRCSCASVFDPVALRSGQAAFRRDDDARAISRPCVEGSRDEALVVAGLRGVPAVGVRRVEEGNAGIERGVQDRDAVGRIPVALRGKPHAAHSDARRGGWSDGRDHDRGLMGESR